MAQAQVEKQSPPQEAQPSEQTPASFKFNAHAPEFVPSKNTQTQAQAAQGPVSGYFYPCFQFVNGQGSDWFYMGDQESMQLMYDSTWSGQPNNSKNTLTNDLRLKIVKQVEYQLSDMSLLANESISKCMNKDPEGYVPIPVIASTKKIKSLVTNHQLLAQALRSSSKLVVSSDGKKVKRKHPFTDKDREDLLSRTVVAENLPEDHSHHNIEKIFNVVGRIKSIRLCHPPDSNSSRPKGDFVISNKLHALIEYETSAVAEKAVEKLNDERNWRKGLRVRTLLRCSPKSVLKGRKSDFDGIMGDDETGHDSADDLHSTELGLDNNGDESSSGTKKGFGRGRGKGRARAQTQTRPLVSQSSNSSTQCEGLTRQNSKGPRMPDGTRGFAVGRGKPIATPV